MCPRTELPVADHQMSPYSRCRQSPNSLWPNRTGTGAATHTYGCLGRCRRERPRLRPQRRLLRSMCFSWLRPLEGVLEECTFPAVLPIILQSNDLQSCRRPPPTWKRADGRGKICRVPACRDNLVLRVPAAIGQIAFPVRKMMRPRQVNG